jgi:hyperosmotically inducible periplasmic protein
MLRRSLVTLALVGGLTTSFGFTPLCEAQTAPNTPSDRKQAPAATATDDKTLEDRIEYNLETNAVVRKYNLDVKVDKGVATLTGDVATAAQKSEAEKLAKVRGVTRVDNRIEIDPNEDKSVADRISKGLSRTGESVNDAWILTKVKWFHTGADALKGSDVNVDVKDGVVTLKGTVKTEAGRAKAIALAKDTDGVKRVVDQLTIK